MFMDAGYETVLQHVQQTFAPMIEQQGEQLIHADAKSRLQEHLQDLHNEGPQYVLDKEEGPAHARVFFRVRPVSGSDPRQRQSGQQKRGGTAGCPFRSGIAVGRGGDSKITNRYQIAITCRSILL